MNFFDIGIEVSSKLPFLRLWGSYLGVLLGFEHHCSWKDIFWWTGLQLEIFQLLLSQAFMVIITLYYYGIIWLFIISCARHFCNWASYWNRTETTWLQNKYISQSCMYRTLQELIAIFSPDVKFSVSYVNIYHFFEKWKLIDLTLRKILSFM